MPVARLAKITLATDPLGLRLEWADGFAATVPLATLRRECPCAVCKGERLPFDPQPLALPSYTPLAAGAAELREMFKVGNYALGFRWGDGHDTGIYSFDYLRELAERG